MSTATEHSLDVVSVLTSFTGGPCVSIYLPLHDSGAEIENDTIQLKILVNQVSTALLKRGEKYSSVDMLLAPARQLIQDLDNRRGSHGGLALFLAPGFFRRIEVTSPFPPYVALGDRFHLLPLLPLMQGDGRYYFLALDKHGCRLFKGSRQTFHRVALPEIAYSLEETTGDNDGERRLQLHSGNRPPNRNKGHRSGGVFHGRGNAEDRHKHELFEYFRSMDREIRKYLGSSTPPLVLGGVEYMTAIYRQATGYRNVVEGEVGGSLGDLDMRQLHERSWKVAEPHFESVGRKAMQRLHSLLGTGLASTDTDTVLAAADRGRVESLFITDAGGTAIDGSHVATSDSLLNLAAVETLTTGGEVFNVAPDSFEDGAAMAAIFRY